MNKCWVCLATDTAVHERIGGMRCVDSGPCEARQAARLPDSSGAAMAEIRAVRDVEEMASATGKQLVAWPWTGLGCDVCGFGSVENVDEFDPTKPCPECATVATPVADAPTCETRPRGFCVTFDDRKSAADLLERVTFYCKGLVVPDRERFLAESAWMFGAVRSARDEQRPGEAQVIALGKSYTDGDLAIATEWATAHPSPSNADLARLIGKLRRERAKASGIGGGPARDGNAASDQPQEPPSANTTPARGPEEAGTNACAESARRPHREDCICPRCMGEPEASPNAGDIGPCTGCGAVGPRKAYSCSDVSMRLCVKCDPKPTPTPSDTSRTCSRKPSPHWKCCPECPNYRGPACPTCGSDARPLPGTRFQP